MAFAGTSTEVTQGTLMYAIGTSATEAPALTAFSATVPTAENVGDDGGNVYVWYYIQGADTPDGQEATEENTFNDTEICTTPLTVPVLSNKFDLTLKAANANTIDATPASKGSVSVAGTDKTGEITDEGKLTAIKMGSEVKLNANTGYKFRKVEVKKASGPLDNTTTAWSAGTYAVPAGGLTYSDAITVSGDVTLTLTDGETLTLNKGISLASGATLTIQGNGTMNVNGTNGADNNFRATGASAGSGTEAISGSGTVVLTSGTLTATGGKGGNVDDYFSDCKGGHGAAGISCTLIVNGGTVTATGGNGGSLTSSDPGWNGVAGNGGAGISGALTVNGGTLTATGGDGGAKSNGQDAQAGTNGRGISSTWTAGTGITFSDSANGTTWTTNSGTSSTQKYVKAE